MTGKFNDGPDKYLGAVDVALHLAGENGLLSDEEKRQISKEGFAERLGTTPDEIGVMSLGGEELNRLYTMIDRCRAAIENCAATFTEWGFSPELTREILFMLVLRMHGGLPPVPLAMSMEGQVLASAIVEGVFKAAEMMKGRQS